MKKSLLILVFVITSIFQLANAQERNWTWAKDAKTSSIGSVRPRQTVDNQGNVYTLLFFDNTLTIGTQNFTVTTPTLALIKYNSAGALQWIQLIKATEGMKEYYDVTAVNSSRSEIPTIVVVGNFEGTLTIPQEYPTINTTTANSFNGDGSFVAQINGNNGKAFWTTIEPRSTPDNEGFYTVCTDNLKDIYIAGRKNKAPFFTKYSRSGIWQWSEAVIASATIDAAEGEGIAAIAPNDIIVAGRFSKGTLTFGSYTIQPSSGSTSFIARLNRTSGTAAWQWALRNISPYKGFAQGPAGPVLSGNNFYIAQYNNSGNQLWDKRDDMGTARAFLEAVAADQYNNIYVTGTFVSGSITAGNTLITNTTTAPDGFVVKINAQGQPV